MASAVRTADPAPRDNPQFEFKSGERIVYPAHGVGKIVRVEHQEVAGIKLELYVASDDQAELRRYDYNDGKFKKTLLGKLDKDILTWNITSGTF